MLHALEALTNRIGHVFAQQDTDRAIEFIDVPDRRNARRILRQARAIGKARGAGIAGARIDTSQAIRHARQGMSIKSAMQPAQAPTPPPPAEYSPRA